jgi:hypothetical protein
MSLSIRCDAARHSVLHSRMRRPAVSGKPWRALPSPVFDVFVVGKGLSGEKMRDPCRTARSGETYVSHWFCRARDVRFKASNVQNVRFGDTPLPESAPPANLTG